MDHTCQLNLGHGLCKFHFLSLMLVPHFILLLQVVSLNNLRSFRIFYSFYMTYRIL